MTVMSATATAPGLDDLARATSATRNRAIDAYRAAAMLAVAVGHWLAISITSSGGGLTARNALEVAPRMAWMTWLFQVMPLFFVVGGYSSAMSLDAHRRDGGRPADWILARLRRTLAPTIVLATVWLAVVSLGTAAGAGGLAAKAAVGGAIPLWFLANYTIDIVLAPWLLPRFRRSPGRVATAAVALFAAIEVAHASGVPYVEHLNWVLGWLLFQILGFAWRDGRLGSARAMASVAAVSWAATIAAVRFGPWPVSMIHIAGMDRSPTHPPSTALVLYGLATSATAIAAAPRLSAWLARRPAAWRAVVAGNSMAMSVYLWHFTAAIVAGVVLWPAGLLPSATEGTAAWWAQKLPLIALAAVVTAAIVAVVSRVERRALLAPRTRWRAGSASMVIVGLGASAALKLWSLGSPAPAVVGLVLLVALWHAVLHPTRFADPAAATDPLKVTDAR